MEYNVEKISSKIARKNAINKIIKKIVCTLLIIVAIINLVLLYYNFKGEESPNVFGLYFFNIVSGSMKPTLQVNDIIITKQAKANDYQKGDIITFKQNNKVISHRIVQVINTKQSKVFVTKGDNNKIEDSDYVSPEQIYGKVIFHIPKIGKIVEYIQNKAGFARVILIVIIVFVLICLRDDKKNKRKMIRKKYEIKKIRDEYN